MTTNSSLPSEVLQTSDTIWKIDSIILTLLLVMILSIVPILTISGNCLVVWAILTQKCLQQVQNRLLISLAVADVLVALTVMPFAIFMEVAVSWKFGFIVCDVWRTMDVMCCTASILHLCAIALDRYWAITEPFTYSVRRNKRLMSIIIAIVWISSLIISLPPVTIWYGEGHGMDGLGCELIVDPVYIIYSAVGSFYGPLAAMFVIYARIYHVAAERLRAKSERRSTYSSPGTSQYQLKRINKQTEIREMKTKMSEHSMHSKPTNSTLQVPTLTRASVSVTNNSEHASSKGGDRSQHKSSFLTLDIPTRDDATINNQVVGACPPSPSRGRIRKPLISVTVERKAANTLGVILGCFVLSWLPFFTLYIMSPFVDAIQNLPYLVTSLVTWMGYFNSMANPIIYTIFNPDFRKAFSKIFKCLDTTPQYQVAVPLKNKSKPALHVTSDDRSVASFGV